MVQVRNANVFKYQVGVTVTGESLNMTVPDALKNFGSPVVSPPSGARSTASLANKPWEGVYLIRQSLDQVRAFGNEVRAIIDGVDIQPQRRAAVDEIQRRLDVLAQTLYFNIERLLTDFPQAGDSPLGPPPGMNVSPTQLTSLTERLLQFLPRLKLMLQGMMNEEAKRALEVAGQIEQGSADFRKAAEQIVGMTQTALHRDYLTTNFGPYQVTTDSSTLTVSVLPLNTASAPAKAADAPAANVVAVPARTVRLRTTTGFKIDFSAGLLVTSLTDRNYTTRPVKNTNPQKYRIVEGSQDEFSFNAAAFTHFYWRRPGFLSGYGLSLAIAARNNPIYGVGASLFFGERQRFVLTAGLAFGSVSRLNGYPEGGTLSTTTVPTANRVRSAPFAGLSYNF